MVSRITSTRAYPWPKTLEKLGHILDKPTRLPENCCLEGRSDWFLWWPHHYVILATIYPESMVEIIRRCLSDSSGTGYLGAPGMKAVKMMKCVRSRNAASGWRFWMSNSWIWLSVWTKLWQRIAFWSDLGGDSGGCHRHSDHAFAAGSSFNCDSFPRSENSRLYSDFEYRYWKFF